MTKIPLLLVDGHNLLWRAAFGFPARVRAIDGRDITAAFGFFALLRVAQAEIGTGVECVVCFDGELGPASRQLAVPTYKAKRRSLDMSPIKALPSIKAALSTQRIRWIEMEDEEADDVIASLAERYQDRNACILTTDNDFYQLLSRRLRILNTARRPGNRFVTAEEVSQRFGVEPRQWCDFKALTGDSSDEIVGVTGVGPKIAARWLSGEKRLEDLDGGDGIEGVLGRRLRRGWSTVLSNRELLRLKSNLRVAQRVTGEPTPRLQTAARILEAIDLWNREWTPTQQPE